MHRTSLPRRITKWGSLALCTVSVAAWIFSTRAAVAYPRNAMWGAVTLDAGMVTVEWGGRMPELAVVWNWPEPPSASGIDVRPASAGLGLRYPSFGSADAWRRAPGQQLPNAIFEQWIQMPMWLLMLCTGLPAAWLWSRDRRRSPPGHCRQCGYNLTGNTSGRCPECGTACPKPS